MLITTNAGLELIAEAVAEGRTVVLDKVAFGDGGGSAITPSPSATGLVNEVYRGNPIYLGIGETVDQIKVQGVVPADVGGFVMREVGIYAGDVLFSYGSLPDTPKAVSGEYSDSFRITLEIKVANASVITVLMIAQDYVTKEYVDEALRELPLATPETPGVSRQGTLEELIAGGDPGSYVSTAMQRQLFTKYNHQWVRRELPLSTSWYSVTYGNGLFVAIQSGGYNYLHTSPDGITWTQRTLPVGVTWYSVAYGNGLFVVVGFGGVVVTSPDGITWTQSASAVGNARIIRFGGGLFVLMDTGNIALTSPDGITWTERALPASAGWYSLVYGNGLFVALASNNNIAATSPDGITWTEHTLPVNATWSSVAYGNGLFVAVASNSNIVITSPDGITWTQNTSLAGASGWREIAYGNGWFVAVGTAASFGVVATSPDGVNWTQNTLPVSAIWYSVAFGKDLFVAIVNNSNIAITLDVSDNLVLDVKYGGTGAPVAGAARLNLGVPAIPAASENGQWVIINSSGSSYVLPVGGTWAYFLINFASATNPQSSTPYAGVVAGGTQIINTAGYKRGFAWRIA